MRTIDEIIIHTAAVRPDFMIGTTAWAKRMTVKRWHVQDRGWRDIGYHAVGDRDGQIATGRDTDWDGDVWEEIGAHVAGENRTTLGYCLWGGLYPNGLDGHEDDKFSTHYTDAQEVALVEWINDRVESFPTIVKVSGHNEYAAKACPCFNVPTWWSDVKRRRPILFEEVDLNHPLYSGVAPRRPKAPAPILTVPPPAAGSPTATITEAVDLLRSIDRSVAMMAADIADIRDDLIAKE
jgi:hypothetical protein